MTIDKLITDFLEYLEIEKGRANNSIANYDRYLQVFARFCAQNEVKEPEKIGQELIRQFRLDLNRRGISKVTQNYYLIALRSFLKYLSSRGIQTYEVQKIELAKTSERQITFLDENELEEIFSKPDLKTIQGRRDKAILDLFFSTGLRVSELCNLKITDINLEKSEFSVRGKGGKVRVVFLDSEAKESLKRYLNARTDKSEWLFVSYGHTNKQPDNVIASPTRREKQSIIGITPRSVQRMIKKYSQAAGITKKVSPHTMRHSFATDLLQNGADLRAVQSLLGHKSVTTTQIYTHVTDQHLQDVHQAFHGLRRKNNDEDEDQKTPQSGVEVDG